ncbi:hypothetical protein GCM10027275_29120 [Rhabdobacter roseus]|uniref:Uncharacterized protein n=1 Tax=Rhabdobacter roseus TaxID=1655419 RepID=A0A840TUC6_9BACT|nr:hypothetical protein [Rhabdobacter roseus]MBB5284863.1 hypothetical protein [Rhabdobacter roseus]
MNKAYYLLGLILLWGCEANETVRLQKRMEADWQIQRIIFSPLSGGPDSLVNYSAGKLSFNQGKAGQRNTVLYALERLKPIGATYVVNAGNSISFNEPCCNVDWSQIYILLQGEFKVDFLENDEARLTGLVVFADKPGKPMQHAQFFIKKMPQTR